MRFPFAVLVLHPRDDVVVRRHSHDVIRSIGLAAPLGHLRDRPHHGTHGLTVVGLDDDPIARTRSGGRRQRRGIERLRSPDGRELDRDEPDRFEITHSWSTSQSATILTPAFR